MDDMASREYWERSWTIQEASVNFSCYIFCGPSPPLPLASFIFGHMALGLFYYIYHLEYIILPYRLHLPTYGFYIGEDPIDEQVLESLCLTKVTLDVDKIFALKAMFPRALSTLLVDYSRPARDVYIDAARLMLEATQSVKFLRHACHGSRMDGFPTWVPAWNAGSYIPTKISKFVPAMVSQHPIVSQDSDKHILKLKALRVDTATASISKLFQILHPLSVPWSRSMALDAAEETCDVFKNWVEASLDTNETELKLNQLASLVAGVLDLKADEIRSWFPKIWEEGEYGTGLQSPEARKVSRDFPALMTGRSLFTTEDGRVGMSTLVICEGDEIVMLSGEEFPYLIRKCPSQPGNYTLVCPYWTSGAVNGEAWPSRSGNGLEEDLEYIELV
ncbi:hypothetical protein F4781DRAFT_412989 [Annulohypoxylon bovei var. microspora]|nr:hypothetical protein F4781DRAFT_412989 [Annulohypoxylon bovei var. microspora]